MQNAQRDTTKRQQRGSTVAVDVTPARYQWIQIDQASQLYYFNTSRCKGTENYPPSGGGWLVEAGKAVETAASVTVAFDEDTPVKGAQYLSICIFLIPSLIFPRPVYTCLCQNSYR